MCIARRKGSAARALPSGEKQTAMTASEWPRKVRTSARALTKLEELAVEAAGSEPVDVAVCHLANDGQAAPFTAALLHWRERTVRVLDQQQVVAAANRSLS